MIARRSGSILIIGSTAMLNPFYRETSYRISKASLAYYAEVLAVELASHGIRVNTIIPGFFLTKLSSQGMAPDSLKKILAEIPLRTAGDPPDIGGQAVVLLSDRLSRYTTGATVVVDGGLHLRPLPFLSDEEIARLNTAP
jgi:NAD(P)-dependent dehydrogenase (short-subunit alcohol dehydrogenase family)